MMLALLINLSHRSNNTIYIFILEKYSRFNKDKLVV